MKDIIPTKEEQEAISFCWKNDLAYVVKPIRNSKNFNVIKYQISNYKEVFYLKEKNKNLEFTQEEALKKTFELYKFHTNRLRNEATTLR